MNYRKEFETCFEYVESHLKDGITTEELANVMGYSLYHFCRVFYAYQGMTPMEYVLERRLAAAFGELQQGRKVIDVSCDYCFETPSGFTKAFRKKYGISPAELKRTWKQEKDRMNDTNAPMKSCIRDIEPIGISGYSMSLDYGDSAFKEELAAYWEGYEENNIEERLYATLNPKKHAEIGVVVRKENDRSIHSYLLGVMEQNKSDNLPWVNYTIAGGKYAVFTTAPVDMTKCENDFAKRIKDTWRYIFGVWFESTTYQYDESREAFEYYDERCHFSEYSVMDIYIPIKE